MNLKKLQKVTYIRIGVILLSFFLMVFLSYTFITSIISKQLYNNTEHVLNYTQSKIENNIIEIQSSLEGFSKTLQDMIDHNYSVEDIKKYNKEMAQYFFFSLNPYSYSGLFGYFEYLDEPFMIESYNWDNSEYDPKASAWFKEMYHNQVNETIIYDDAITGEISVVYTTCVHSKITDKRVAIIGIRIQMDVIDKIISDTSIGHGSYAILLDKNYNIISHPNKEFLKQPITILNNKNIIPTIPDISNYRFEGTNFEGLKVLVFGKKLFNDWTLIVVTPKGPYFENTFYILLVLISLGLFFSIFLIIAIINLDLEKNKVLIENRNKSVFLANMSHEIRTPLNVIIGMTTIGKNSIDNTKRDHCFTQIEEASSHLLGVVNDILDLSKIEAGKLALVKNNFIFRTMVQHTVNIINYKVNSKSQTLITNIDDNIPEVLIGDDLRLSQVITNLLSNANKFTPANGTISLEVKLLDKTEDNYIIQFLVKDSGIGINKEQQKKIFKPFEQATENTTQKYGGTGLGLKISKNIVEMMDGDIWVESDMGKGATFYFTIKLKEGTIEKNKEDNDIIPVLSQYKILVVEDIDINREIIGSLLETTEINIDYAENGVQALEKASRIKYDLIFMDVNMPIMNGLEAAEKIRKFNPSIPIIAMTANVFKEDIDECIKAGMTDHVGKPIDINKLIEKLKFYLRSR